MKYLKPLFVAIVILACSDSREDAQLKESFEIHEKSVAIYEELKNDLEKLNSNLSEVLNEQDTIMQDTLKQFQLDFKDWESNLIEVPGFEHDHDHSGHDYGDHDHHHHDDNPNLTPEMMLEVQKHLYVEIMNLKSRLKKYKNNKS